MSDEISYEMRQTLQAELKQLIQSERFEEAVAHIKKCSDYWLAESFVLVVLDEGNATPELVDVVLQCFFDSRKHQKPEHGRWVHSYSHFSHVLWKRRLVEWVKKFNGVAFQGANELGDPNCCERLVCNFGQFSKFSDDPAEFFLTPAHLCWMHDERRSEPYLKKDLARIEAGRFGSEALFLHWKLQKPKDQYGFFEERTGGCHTINVKAFRSVIQRLQELGEDVLVYNVQLRGLLEKQLDRLSDRLNHADPIGWRFQMLERLIEQTRVDIQQVQ